ncbi:DUF3859 domain-containing protein [Alloyangia pacifica]|uniref:DUF3859 domain-containing protein n=1 Tax=Alloyangia pacifica TaxID=311180 RepID=A0A1I6UAY1_9RHOB|nr:DUF3859 domain-containing protein [Alloyangia pacifica]SDH45084.1 protein of unknown function [Alloyangia pacifica]SFS98600.1 protein of unknown function [Alloyangia pacifica]
MRAFAILMTLAGPALAGSGLSFAEAPVVLLERGVICQVTPEGARPAPETEKGVINLISPGRRVDVATEVVPAALGISFGIRFTLDQAADPMALQVVVTHPPMGPRAVEVESWTTGAAPGEPSVSLFTFEYAYEMVEGAWTMALEANGERLLEQHFTVVPADAARPVLAACDGPAPMS